MAEPEKAGAAKAANRIAFMSDSGPSCLRKPRRPRATPPTTLRHFAFRCRAASPVSFGSDAHRVVRGCPAQRAPSPPRQMPLFSAGQVPGDPMHRQSLVEYAKPLQPTDAETPKPQGTEVLLRVSHCGVCHSDLHLQDGYFDLGGGNKLDVQSGRKLPFTLGHEIAGVVEAVGPDAQGVAKGKRFAAYPWIGCGKCGLCARGDEHLCNAPRALGITVDGGYATHVMVPHPRYLLDVEGISPAIAGALMCSGLTGYSAIKNAVSFLRAGPVLIVGLGGVGMMGLQFARAMTDK